MRCYDEIEALSNGLCDFNEHYKKDNRIVIRKNVSYIVCAVIIKNNLIFLQQETKGRFKKKWYLPGGKVEKRENLETALVREVEEEAGVICQPISLTSIECDDGKWFRFIYNCKIIGQSIKVNKNLVKAKWFPISQIYDSNVNLRYEDLKEKLDSVYFQNYIKNEHNQFKILPKLLPHYQLAAQLLVLCHIELPKLILKVLVDHNKSLPIFNIHQSKFKGEHILKEHIQILFDTNTQPYDYKQYGVLAVDHCANSSNLERHPINHSNPSDGLVLGVLIKLKFKEYPNFASDGHANYTLKRLKCNFRAMFKNIINNGQYIPFSFVHL